MLRKKGAVEQSATSSPKWHRSPYLSSWGIPVVHHLPYVGQFLYDNPRNGISITPSNPLEHSIIQVVGITEILVLTLKQPQISSLLLLLLALSSGSLRLASTDVRTNPIVRFHYFSNPDDLG